MNRICCILSIVWVSVTAIRSPAPASVLTQRQIEDDWLRQDELRNTEFSSASGGILPEEDALGGCDGIKNGKWGFHTENEQNPWWQIDLEKSCSLDRLVVYNRCDLADRASRMIVLASDDGDRFRQVYQHDGSTFYGYSDQRPLLIQLRSAKARYVRLQLPGSSYFHLDEVELYSPGGKENIALGKPATQSSTSQWSARHIHKRDHHIAVLVDRGLKLAENLRLSGVDVAAEVAALERVADQIKSLPQNAPEETSRPLYFEVRRAVRKMAFSNPLLDFDAILFVKRAPGTLPHMSDQYFGWWSRPGGGVFLLQGFKEDRPRLRCLTEDWEPGSFLRPELSYDGTKILFSYCKYYPHVAGMEKTDKEKLPEDSFYHIFEMNVDGSGCKQLSRGRYDDFDGRYLPNGDIVFLSTRKGQFIQCGKDSASATRAATLPDSFVRCGGDSTRPCSIYTLHAMDSHGDNLRAISAFESFEWTPSVANDGRLLYARWDYIDRFNGHLMSLWSSNPDGTNPQLVFGNFTASPQCVFEPRSIPNSRNIVFTASAHHSITGGSVVLLDRTLGTEGSRPLTRLTPDARFPEAEGWDEMYYANPYPLSEQFYLVAWSDRRLPPHHGSGQVTGPANPVNALGLYLYDAFGNLDLIYRDEAISSMNPIPLRSRNRPPVLPDTVNWGGVQEGRFLVQDVYQGLKGIARGGVARLRIVGVPPKTQPYMDSPNLGVSKEDPGKFVLGTVPVEADGSAYFRVPSGVPLFFQALDNDGVAVQTMRTLTYVQPGQTLSCVGCHESRERAPAANRRPRAILREPSRILPGPEGSWPLRFDRLVQPVLDGSCTGCHRPDGDDPEAARFDLTPGRAYQNLLSFADKNLETLAFERDRSIAGQCPARQSKLLAILTDPRGHAGTRLDTESLNRLILWMDVYAHRQGSFSAQQEEDLLDLRRRISSMLEK